MNIVKKLIIISFLLSVTFTQTLALQGVLREPTGNTVEDGYFKMTFKLYTDENGGTEIWEEVHPSVPVKNGVYAVELGSINAFTGLSFSVQYYVGVSIEEDPELVPRVKLTNSPTALAVFGDENIFPSSGNVGVGTTDPNALLNISQTGSEDLLNIENDSGGLIVNADGNVGIGTAEPTATIELITDDDSDLINISSATENFIVKSSGNVGIGVANPSATLDIENSGDTDLLNLKNGDDELIVDADGIMHIPNSINFPDGSVLTTAEGTTASSLTSPGNTDIVADDDDNGSGDIQFRTGDETQMVINNSGVIDVEGSINVRDMLKLSGSDSKGVIEATSSFLDLRENSAEHGIVIRKSLTETSEWGNIEVNEGNLGLSKNSTSPQLAITDAGNVGIGLTSPEYKLDVNGTITSRNMNAFRFHQSDYGLILRNANGNTFFLLTDYENPDGGWNSLRPLKIFNATGNVQLGNSALHVEHAGNVGIGTSSPSAKLDVNGDTEVNGDATISGDLGVGTTDPGVRLQIEGGSDVDDETANSGYQIIGDPAGSHLAFDNNEIMAKSSGNEVGPLYIQNEGGLTQFDGPVDIQEWAESSGLSSSNSYEQNGYMKLGNLIIQWGWLDLTTDNAFTITFPTSYSNACFGVFLNAPTQGERAVHAKSFTRTNFVIDRDNDLDGTTVINWFSIGF